MSSIKYELKYKIQGFSWVTFDTYADSGDPDIKKFAGALRSMTYNDGVKLVKIETIRTEIDL